MAQGENLASVLLVEAGLIRLREQNTRIQEHRESEHLSSHAFSDES